MISTYLNSSLSSFNSIVISLQTHTKPSITFPGRVLKHDSSIPQACLTFTILSLLIWVLFFTGNSALYLFECYDTRTESWHTKPSMLTQRCSHGMVEANGLIYVCGGSLGNNVSGRVLSSCEVYDPATETYVSILDDSVSVILYYISSLSEDAKK